MIRGTATNGTKYVNFLVPHMKTDSKGADIYMSDSTCNCSVTITFEHHLTSNTNILPSAPLFMFEKSDGPWDLMRRAWFLDRCNEVWAKENLTLVKGHGFCIGSTMHLLLLGVNLWVVMAQGHWSLQLFLLYWCHCKEILALFIGFSFQTHKSISTTMSSFKSNLPVPLNDISCHMIIGESFLGSYLTVSLLCSLRHLVESS